MTIGTLTREDTGSHSAITQIDIDIADGNPLGIYWTPPRLPALLAGDHIADADDIREANRLTQAKLRQLEMLEDEVAYWHSVASRAWAKQSEAVSIVSDTYRAKRQTVEVAYRDGCQQIWGMLYHGVLDTPPQPALPVSPEGKRFLEQGPAVDEAMPGRASDREGLNKLTGRVKTAISAGPASEVGASERTSKSETSQLEVGRWRRWARRVWNWDGTGA